jgi:hypothetical protein
MTTHFEPLHREIPLEAAEVLEACPGYTVARNIDDLVELAVRDAGSDGWHPVTYDIPGAAPVQEAQVCRVKNGIAANYLEPYMRRRDPGCMFIADDRPTDKPRFSDNFDVPFDDVRRATFEWLKTQELALFYFVAGARGIGVDAMAIAPANAGFFALGLAQLQGILDARNLPEDFAPKSVIYVAPPFRHTQFDGKQVVVHNRLRGLHELFSYNLYPGPSAKKGVYGVLIHLGEKEDWVTAHCSTVQVITPYDNRITIMHEGASGGGKSEMLEQMHREPDGRLLLGTNKVTEESYYLIMPRNCDLRPVTDDMALCHPSFDRGDGRLALMDAEDAWFIRTDHILEYGTDPHLESVTVHPPAPLLFLNIDAAPGSTALIWEHIEDAPGRRCPNPRVVVPRHIVPGVIQGQVRADVRSFGVRTPPCTAEDPSYGIIGLFHVIPPALAWLWRLVSPRGHANPSIVESEGMSSEGVGSYWPFATGRKVDQANLLLQQIIDTPEVRYIICPNQHVGAWKTGFMPQWIVREYLARRGGAWFAPGQLKPARCPLLGYALDTIMIEGQTIGHEFLQVECQPEVGIPAYDKGAEILAGFFHRQIKQFLHPELMPEGRRIIEACIEGVDLNGYIRLLEGAPIIFED